MPAASAPASADGSVGGATKPGLLDEVGVSSQLGTGSGFHLAKYLPQHQTVKRCDARRGTVTRGTERRGGGAGVAPTVANKSCVS